MIFHENCLLADNSHDILMLIKRRPPRFTGFVKNKYRHEPVMIANL